MPILNRNILIVMAAESEENYSSILQTCVKFASAVWKKTQKTVPPVRCIYVIISKLLSHQLRKRVVLQRNYVCDNYYLIPSICGRRIEAIVVTPMGVLRMSEVSYIAQAKRQDLNLSIGPKSGYGSQPEDKDRSKGFAPGFENDESGSDLQGQRKFANLGRILTLPITWLR